MKSAQIKSMVACASNPSVEGYRKANSGSSRPTWWSFRFNEWPCLNQNVETDKSTNLLCPTYTHACMWAPKCMCTGNVPENEKLKLKQLKTTLEKEVSF